MPQFKAYKTTLENALGAKRYIVVSLTLTFASTVGGVLIWYTGVTSGVLAIVMTILVGFAFISAYFAYHFFVYADSTRRKLTLITDLEDCLDRLSVHLDEGNSQIFNAPISNEKQIAEWIRRSQEWQTKVERFLSEHFGLRERNTFKHIVLLEHKIQGFNPLHTLHRNILAWKLLAIKEIILRYSNIAARWSNSSYP